jgi:2-C-methyl-D-erythritol 4-phosphate cytidylyltransferase
VTDRVVEVVDGIVVDHRSAPGAVSLASPVVMPAAVVAQLADAPGNDLVALVELLRGRFPVEEVEAPPAARRTTSVEDVRVLEAETGPGDPPVSPRSTGPGVTR